MSDTDFDTPEEARKDPTKDLRRWLLEINLAKKREKNWRKQGRDILEKYRGTNSKKNSFNILWANTETLRPALYNSAPKPDVRRRFRQGDMLGKAVSELSERALSYCIDAYDLDAVLKNNVLEALLPGRAVARIKYIPVMGDDDASVDYEQALCEQWQWDEFLHGAGKTWDEVTWVAFEHSLMKDDLEEKFGADIADQITLDSAEETETENHQSNADLAEVFKRARLWEVWDKEGARVFFVSESYKKGLLFSVDAPNGEPPLKFKKFFPCPRPMMMVEDSASLVPIPLYELYKEQAEELDRVSARINKIINALKVRGVYDSTLSELSELMAGEDNTLVPASQARAWMANGGLEKAIWWMPIQQAAAVLKELYISRDAAKQVIYEITGISDILRGATNPHETLGAQKLKANSANLRLNRMQKEVQRYTRDLIRLLAEVIGEHFSTKTLAQMTGMNFPTNVQKQGLQLQAQAMAQQGQPISQPMQTTLSMPSWEEVMAVMKSDIQREYRVDVETNSTVAESLADDMEGLKEVLTGLVEFWSGVAPAVQSGALSVDAVKQISITIARRARMGLEIEDALETGMKQPAPEVNQAQVQAEGQAKIEQEKSQREAAQNQADLQREQMQAQETLAREQQQRAADLQRENEVNRHKEALEADKRAHDRAVREMELASEESLAKYKIDQDNATKVTVAEIQAEASVNSALESGGAKSDGDPQGKPQGKPKRQSAIDKLAQFHAEGMQAQQATLAALAKLQSDTAAAHSNTIGHLVGAMSASKELVRGADGRVIGLRTVQ